nr:MAG TPA: hypothetical protein [Caudoviricetes sp.]
MKEKRKECRRFCEKLLTGADGYGKVFYRGAP